MTSLPMLSWDLKDKRVFVRADLNTDLHLFAQSLKFTRLLPTLKYLHNAGARITLATHLGRPAGGNSVHADIQLSTKQLVPAFQEAGFSCAYATPETVSALYATDVALVLLENLRFYSQEESHAQDFAQKITAGCDYFVEEGFGVLARDETSVTTAVHLFAPENRSIGFLIEQELKHLTPLKQEPKKPYLVMVGGGKGAEKLKTLYHFLDKATHVALCPGLSELPEAQAFIQKAQQAGVTLLLPEDYIISDGKKISIGPKTLEAWQPVIMTMQTIVYNGLMGFIEQPETTVVTHELFKLFVMQKNAQVVIAGGDTTLAAQQWNSYSDSLFLSTGGGATLAYLAGQTLPGLTVVT